MAAHGSPDECGICNNEFNEEERCPRIFTCFHTVCNSCIAQLIRNKRKRCPFCRTIFHAHSSDDVTKNYLAIELIKYYTGTKSKRFKQSEVASQQMIITELKKEAIENSIGIRLNIEDASKQIEHITKKVQLMKKTIIQENERIESYICHMIQDVISENKRAADELDHLLKLLESTKKEHGTSLADSLQGNSADVDEADGMTEDITAKIKNFQKVTDEREKTFKAVHMELENVKENINIILDELNPRQESQEPMLPNFPVTSNHDRITSDKLISVQALQQRDDFVKHMVESGKVFGVQQFEGREEYARLSVTEGKLCMHYYTERKLPPDASVTKHQDLLKLVDPSSRLAFLELSIGSSTLGRLYIQLFSDSAEARNFTALCTGELGECYVNTNILKVNSKGSSCEHVCFGDYEHNDGSGGKALVSGAGFWTGTYKRPWSAGTLEGLPFDGEAKASQFYINTRDNPGNDINPAFGRVVEGLSVLTDALTQHFADLMEIRISDCGIVLPF